MSSKKKQSKLTLNKKAIKDLKKKVLKSLNSTKDYLVANKFKIFLGIVIIFIILLASTVIVNVYYGNSLAPYIKNSADAESLETRNVAIVLGAGLNVNGAPSDMLQDRLDVGYQLLMMGKVNKLILSGDNREVNYNEPEAMKRYLLKKGVSPADLIADYAGRRTYDSCYRAKEIFGQNKVYVVTQEFHIVRAVFLCRALGIDTIGVTADLRVYPDLWENIIRDYVGMLSAVWDAKVTKPVPVLGEKININ